METEDRDSEEAEKPSITFDPSLPTSHAVSDTQALQFSQSCCSFTELCHLIYIYSLFKCIDTDHFDGSTWVQTWRSFMAVQSTMTTAVRPSQSCRTQP